MIWTLLASSVLWSTPSHAADLHSGTTAAIDLQSRKTTFSQDELVNWGAFTRRLSKSLKAFWSGPADEAVHLRVEIARPGEMVDEVEGRSLSVTERFFREPGHTIPWQKLSLRDHRFLVTGRIPTGMESNLGPAERVASVLSSRDLIAENDMIVVVRGVSDAGHELDVDPVIWVLTAY